MQRGFKGWKALGITIFPHISPKPKWDLFDGADEVRLGKKKLDGSMLIGEEISASRVLKYRSLEFFKASFHFENLHSYWNARIST